MLGVRDERIGFDAMELVSITKQGALVGRGQGYEIFAVRWPVFRGVQGDGFMLVPVGGEKLADVVAVPDAQHTPEQLVGLTAGVSRGSEFARRVVRVLIHGRFEFQKHCGFDRPGSASTPVFFRLFFCRILQG